MGQRPTDDSGDTRDMDERDNPYAAPQSPSEKPPRLRVHGIAWLLLEIVVALAIAGALIWLVSTGRRP